MREGVSKVHSGRPFMGYTRLEGLSELRLLVGDSDIRGFVLTSSNDGSTYDVEIGATSCWVSREAVYMRCLKRARSAADSISALVVHEGSLTACSDKR